MTRSPHRASDAGRLDKIDISKFLPDLTDASSHPEIFSQRAGTRCGCTICSQGNCCLMLFGSKVDEMHRCNG